jgi:hypothetical protein
MKLIQKQILLWLGVIYIVFCLGLLVVSLKGSLLSAILYGIGVLVISIIVTLFNNELKRRG